MKKFNINKILSSSFYQVTESSSAATSSNNPDPDTSTVSISTLDQPLMDTQLSVAKEKQKEIGVSLVSKVGKLLLQIGLLGNENSYKFSSRNLELSSQQVSCLVLQAFNLHAVRIHPTGLYLW